ncbi:ATP-dependent zinc metalloprotease FtsH [Christiangramia crocea]|uniref:ATP-dependent zinc metalloprotease FtsH n=1 Tax=Christiangramia crocea TaxID=2904124 RepID=A0A9X1UYS1_9FLAO|nr:ATP-dependent zinc metalloprotease FtsH [Gramella crocea]MCG9972785.1 ATP-dependent zinc metalloprotease FtsH [Gramella crocea]
MKKLTSNKGKKSFQEFEKPGKQKPGSGFGWFYFLVIIFMLIIFVFTRFGNETKPISWLDFEQKMLSQHDVAKIVVVNNEIAEIYIKPEKLSEDKYKGLTDGVFASSTGPHYIMQIGTVESFESKLGKAQQDFTSDELIEVTYSTTFDWISALAWIIPIGLLIFFWMIILRSGRSGGVGNPLFNFGKSTAKLMDRTIKSTTTFKDVAGLKEAKVEIKEIVDFLKNPETYTKLGAKIPKGVLLVGPPGTGKTLMARAVAGEAQVPFFSLSGSEFVEMFVGVGASRVRDLFKKAKESAPSIIFIDEIDAVGRTRDKANALRTNDERESTLNQLLTELDGFGVNTGVIVLAATNRADILDKALLRPGRFDRHIFLELPNKDERKEIFLVHLRPIKKAADVDLEILASLSPGFSGADIANICNEAALIAARKKKNEVAQEDFMEARDRVIGGLERKSKIISPKEKEIIAHHEAGHAVASWYLKNVDALVKVSIIPRGKSLGAAWYLPEEHQIITRSQFIDQICASLGGRAAEEIIFNEVSSGALDDLEKVTKQAYIMVAYYGLDKEIGPISFYDSTGRYESSLVKPYSEKMAESIDREVQNLINTAYETTKGILLEHQPELIKLAQLLLKKEVVEQEDLENILGKRNRETETINKKIKNHEKRSNL